MAAFRSAYKWLRTHYVIFEALQCSLVMGTGDVIAQKIVQKREKLDLRRTATFAATGLLYLGPVESIWYHFLDIRVPYCWNRIKRGLTKTVLDQTLLAPIMLAILLAILEIAEGGGIQEIKKEIENKYLAILKTNYKVWPAVQIFSFCFVPVSLQVLVSQTFGVGWDTYISSVKHSNPEYSTVKRGSWLHSIMNRKDIEEARKRQDKRSGKDKKKSVDRKDSKEGKDKK